MGSIISSLILIIYSTALSPIVQISDWERRSTAVRHETTVRDAATARGVAAEEKAKRAEAEARLETREVCQGRVVIDWKDSHPW